MIEADLAVTGIAELATPLGNSALTGPSMGRLAVVRDAAVACLRGKIVFTGPERDLRDAVSLQPGARLVDAAGGTVLPGFVDAHTLLPFAGWRDREFEERLRGVSYEEIASRGGGILSTVDATRAATRADLVEAVRSRLDAMLALGTTTAEAKSGYGLTLESELTMLRAIRRLDQEHPIDLAPTFMGAHEVPAEYRDRREAYVAHVINDMIPEVAREGLAEWCDVFCERGVFTPEESLSILEAGQNAGLKPRIHANELGPTGGASVAARLHARSADHLVFVDDEEAAALADAGVVATLLPAAAFYLKLGRFAPARRLIDLDVPVALATDVNPGGGFSPSLPFVMSLACFAMGLTLEEALIGTTINAAFALDRSEDVGSLEVGKRCDAVVVNGPAIELLRAGVSAIRAVVKNGRQAA